MNSATSAHTYARRIWPLMILVGLALFTTLVCPGRTLAATDSGSGAKAAGKTLLEQFQHGPMAGVKEFVFAARKQNDTDGHWYANIGYYAHDPRAKPGVREPSSTSGAWRPASSCTLLDDPRGGVRDPQVSYDGKTILFSYRKGGTETYHLFEIGADGSGLRQLTDGDYDDFEPTYLPDGDIVFVSTRCKRWVNCWLTQVAIMHRCDRNGHNIRPISSNNEQDNTPWPLADGRILYTRWEYVDRSQVDYHHLWTENPDGTAQMVWYGNQHPGTVMIDAKPIPGSDKVVASFSPGHGQPEHAGAICVVDPRSGPDQPASVQRISQRRSLPRPVGVLRELLHGRDATSLVVMDGKGNEVTLFRLPEEDVKAGMHAPRASSPGRRVPASRSSPTASSPAQRPAGWPSPTSIRAATWPA